MGGTPPRNNARNFDKSKSSGHVWLSIADLPLGLKPTVIDSKEHLSAQGAARVRVVPEGTLLVSFKLSLGRLAFAGRDLRTNEAIAALRDLDESRISKDYLYWYLTHFDWDKAAEGEDKIKGKTLNKAKLEKLEVFFPPIPEQQRIVGILDETFAGIEAAAHATSASLATSDELMKSGVTALLSFGAADFHQETLGDLCEIYQPKTISTSGMNEAAAYPVFGANGQIGRYHAYNHEEPQLLVTCRGATCGSVNMSVRQSWITGNAMVVRPKGRRLSLRFLRRLFEYGFDYRSVITGSAQPQITRQSLAPSIITFPLDVGEQDRLSDAIEELVSTTQTYQLVLQRKQAALVELKQSLLARAFSGDLTREPLAA